MVYYALTSILTGLTGIHAEELLVNVHNEEVGDDFNVLDYYSLLYLDLLYISKMCYYAISDWFTEIFHRLFGSSIDKKKKE